MILGNREVTVRFYVIEECQCNLPLTYFTHVNILQSLSFSVSSWRTKTKPRFFFNQSLSLSRIYGVLDLKKKSTFFLSFFHYYICGAVP